MWERDVEDLGVIRGLRVVAVACLPENRPYDSPYARAADIGASSRNLIFFFCQL